MNKTISPDIEELSSEYDIIVKNSSDILNDINFKTEDEFLLTKSIISNIEKTAAEFIKSNKTVQLPYIGCLRNNPINIELRKHFVEFNIARKNMSKEEYQTHVGTTVNIIKDTIKDKDTIKHALHRIKQINKSKYDKYFINLGGAYANMYIKAITMLKEIPFNQEVQDQFDKLNGTYIE